MQISPSINKSAKLNRLEFPVREDYVNYFIDNKLIKDKDTLWNDENLVSAIHRHWHGEGRNGCIFALLAARRAEETGWQDYTVTKTIDLIETDNTKVLIQKRISQAINDPRCEVLSLLFSNIVGTKDLVRLIKLLLTIDTIHLTNLEAFENYITLSLRVPINKRDVLSWLMAFGPFDYFPQTRQSPITEIAIRVKEKPDKMFHRLNKDIEAAHLADLPLDYHDHVMEKIWSNTLRRTRLILGNEPNHFSAAKTTFTIPRKEWEEK